MTDYQHIPVLDLIPQRPPFVFVDRLVYYDDETVRSSFTVPETGLLLEDGRLCTAGLMEHIAQTSALRIGYISVYIRHIPVRIGYIGQIRGLVVYRHPLSGERLETELTMRQDIFGITLADAVVRCGEEVLAKASLKTALAEDGQ